MAQVPQRVLLVNDTGAGRTHVEHMLGVGREFVARGAQCLAAVLLPEQAPEFHAAGIATVQVPMWPWRIATGRAVELPKVYSSIDFLANHGITEPRVLAGMIGHYDSLFDMWKPDVIVADLGYGALQAARGRIPFVAAGCSVNCPPLVGDVPPQYLRDGSGPGWDPYLVLDLVNRGLERAGRAPLAVPTDIVRADAQCCMVLEEVDMYRGLRPEPVMPPMLNGFDPAIRSGEGDEVFVYVHGAMQGNEGLVSGLVAAGDVVRLYMSDIEPENIEVFEAFGLIVERRPVPQADIARRSRVVVHHGGPQMTALLLAYGIPQVLVPRFYDNTVSGKAVEELGVGRWRHNDDVNVAWLLEAIEEMSTPEAWARAQALAPHYREIVMRRPAPMVVDRCLELIG